MEQSHYRIFENLRYPVSVIDLQGNLVYSNDTFTRLFRHADSTPSLDFQHPFYPEYRKRIAQAYIHAREGKERQCFAVIQGKDNERIAVELYLFPMYEGEEVSEILLLMNIVDDRLVSFNRSTGVLASENTLVSNQYLEFSPLPIFRVDRDLQVHACSRSFEGFTGFTNEDIMEKRRYSVEKGFSSFIDRFRKVVQQIFDQSIPFQRLGEVKILTKDENERIANLTLYPLQSTEGIELVEIMIEDITTIREMRDRVNQVSRVKLFTDVTKGFLHSLNNTINVIMSKTQLLLQVSEKDSVTEGIQLIDDSAQEIMRQVHRVNNFIGEKQLNTISTENATDILEDAVAFARMQFKVEETEKRRAITLERSYHADVQVQMDTRLLREIIISIILKVASFISRRGIVNLQFIKNSDVHIVVSAQKDLRATATPLPQIVNVFTGINIRESAEKAGVKILEEENAESYTIKARLPPRVIVARNDMRREDSRYRIRDRDILIVEDEEALSSILFELFDKMGNRVTLFTNGLEGLEEFKTSHYDIVICDYGVQGITGLELAARVRELDESVLTVLLSGWSQIDLQDYKSVIDLYLPKPFKLDELIRQIALKLRNGDSD